VNELAELTRRVAAMSRAWDMAAIALAERDDAAFDRAMARFHKLNSTEEPVSSLKSGGSDR
jgi:hypothetical protein